MYLRLNEVRGLVRMQSALQQGDLNLTQPHSRHVTQGLGNNWSEYSPLRNGSGCGTCVLAAAMLGCSKRSSPATLKSSPHCGLTSVYTWLDLLPVMGSKCACSGLLMWGSWTCRCYATLWHKHISAHRTPLTADYRLEQDVILLDCYFVI